MIETLLIIIAGLLIVIFLVVRSYFRLRERLIDTISRKQSLSTKYGKMSEQFMPLLDLYPYDKQKFRFLGSPIDGVQFNEDGVVFIEFKTAGSKLSSEQKRIMDLVRDKKVSFEEIRIPKPEK